MLPEHVQMTDLLQCCVTTDRNLADITERIYISSDSVHNYILHVDFQPREFLYLFFLFFW